MKQWIRPDILAETAPKGKEKSKAEKQAPAAKPDAEKKDDDK
jgi:hypothetical protein